MEYPVAIDNDYAVWEAFANRCWPALYFIDPGAERHHAFGEGDYERSESVIQMLLTEAGLDDSEIRLRVRGRTRAGGARRLEQLAVRRDVPRGTSERWTSRRRAVIFPGRTSDVRGAREVAAQPLVSLG